MRCASHHAAIGVDAPRRPGRFRPPTYFCSSSSASGSRLGRLSSAGAVYPAASTILPVHRTQIGDIRSSNAPERPQERRTSAQNSSFVDKCTTLSLFCYLHGEDHDVMVLLLITRREIMESRRRRALLANVCCKLRFSSNAQFDGSLRQKQRQDARHCLSTLVVWRAAVTKTAHTSCTTTAVVPLLSVFAQHTRRRRHVSPKRCHCLPRPRTPLQICHMAAATKTVLSAVHRLGGFLGASCSMGHNTPSCRDCPAAFVSPHTRRRPLSPFAAHRAFPADCHPPSRGQGPRIRDV